MSRDRRAQKITLYRRLVRERGACDICLRRSKSKRMFSRLRRGTDC